MSLIGEDNKGLGFFDTGQKGQKYPYDLEKISVLDDVKDVEILRGILFFHEGEEKVWVGRLRKYFTDKAIRLLEHDGYIRIIEPEKQKSEKKSDNKG